MEFSGRGMMINFVPVEGRDIALSERELSRGLGGEVEGRERRRRGEGRGGGGEEEERRKGGGGGEEERRMGKGGGRQGDEEGEGEEGREINYSEK